MPRRDHLFGVTLIELMVSLATGALLLVGALMVFGQSRTTFRSNDSIARLHETARFALAALEPDIRMAHYWGLTSRSALILNRRTPAQPNALGPVTCGANWAVDLDRAIAGSNNSYRWACAGSAPVETRADTLIVRRVSVQSEVPTHAATLSIASTRIGGTLFAGTAIPTEYGSAESETHRLIVHGYYVRRASALAPPALRMKTLQRDGTIADQEVLPGVEDMQLEFGLDTDLPGTPGAPNLDRGSIDRWVNPDAPLIDPTHAAFEPHVEILAVRLWLRVRAEDPEQGFTDSATYSYADMTVGPFHDHFRRIVVGKTIYLRNARPPA